MEFKVGDIVTIRKDLAGGYSYYKGEDEEDLYFSEEMEQYCGQKFKIIEIDDWGDIILDGIDDWVWCIGMFEPTNKPKFYLDI